MIESEWPFGLVLLIGMVLAACLDGEWTRWRQRRWVRQWRATREPLDTLPAHLRLLLGHTPQPSGVRRMPPPPYDWREAGDG